MLQKFLIIQKCQQFGRYYFIFRSLQTLLTSTTLILEHHYTQPLQFANSTRHFLWRILQACRRLGAQRFDLKYFRTELVYVFSILHLHIKLQMKTHCLISSNYKLMAKKLKAFMIFFVIYNFLFEVCHFLNAIFFLVMPFFNTFKDLVFYPLQKIHISR